LRYLLLTTPTPTAMSLLETRTRIPVEIPKGVELKDKSSQLLLKMMKY